MEAGSVVGLGPLDLSVDPVDELGGLGVDTRVSGGSAAVAPGDNTAVKAVTGHRATRVTLERPGK